MEQFRYIDGVTTLRLDTDACTGCGNCTEVCPHTVYEVRHKKAAIIDLNGCMECGACALNCPVDAISVNPGVGCASYIIKSWLHDKTGGRVGAGGCC